MGGSVHGGDMERFARERRDEGLRLQKEHREQDGICVTCGRTSPCDDHNAGVELVARYSQFLQADQPEPSGPPNRVRPFALAAVGQHPNGGHW